MMMWTRTMSRELLLVTYMVLQWSRNVHGILPTAAIDVRLANGTTYTLLASQALFGSSLKMSADENDYHLLQLPPEDNPLLCQNVTTSVAAEGSSSIGVTLLVPRGECTFELKVWNAQRLGAKAVLIYGTLESRYSLNTTKYINQTNHQYTQDDIAYPQKFNDYDCSKGRAEIPSSAIELEPLPYNAQHNNPILSGWTESNLCRKNAPDALQNCQSKACLLTGVQLTTSSTTTSATTTMMEACCAWDLYIWLYPDVNIHKDAVSIPAAYVTLEQGNQLLQSITATQQSSSVQIVLYARYRSSYNLSSALIWALGVAVAALAAFLSAGDVRNFKHKIIARQNRALQQQQQQQQQSVTMMPEVVVEEDDDKSNGSTTMARPRSRSPPSNHNMEDGMTAVLDNNDGALPAIQRELRTASSTATNPPLDTLELNAGHALGFVVMASSGLLILFFFKIYNVVKVLYAIGCSKAVAQVLFQPLCFRIARRLQMRDRVVYRTNTEEFGDLTLCDIVAFALGYTLGIAWLLVAFFVRHPENNVFFWVTQDVMGTCMCIMFLSIIKLNSIRVATFLLIVAFLYDIFFVFVTPLIFKGKSVMITVATSGGPPKADPSWCEKYPDDKDCQGGDPLPMLLTVPRIGDYQGGASLLGLGDIVLPGLLLSFAARLDESKSLLGVIGGGNGAFHSYSCPEHKFCGGCRLCSGGYFPPLVVAYAIGLLLANVAVYAMGMGQPALLYLVPACLGTMAFMGWRRNELKGLWDGPKAVRTVDSLIYGESEAVVPSSHYDRHNPVPTEDGIEPPLVPSAQDSPGGDVPLLS